MKFFAGVALSLLFCVLWCFPGMASHELSSAGSGFGDELHSRWKNWDGNLKAVQIELEEINRRSQEIEESLNRDLMKEDQAFLEWWFSRPEASLDLVFLRALLNRSEVYFAPKIARASLREKSWRTAEWVSDLIPFPGTAEFILKALTSPELMNDEGLNQVFLNTSEFHEHLYWTYFRLFLADPLSTIHGERIRRIVAAHLHAEYGPYFFLQYGGASPHWIDRQAQVVEFALRNIRSPFLMRDVVVQKLLRQPASAVHPEWLEYVVKHSSAYADFMDPELNQILSLPHWSKHPRLLGLLHGKPLQAENLRRATNWGLLDAFDCGSLLRKN